MTRGPVQRGLAASRPGLLVLFLAGLSLGLHLWLVRSVLVPLTSRADVEYVFVSANFETFLSGAILAWALILIGHLSLRRVTARWDGDPTLFSRQDVAYLQPLFCFAASASALLTLVPGLDPLLPVWSYLVVDLRWWWTLLVLVWILVRVDQRLHGVPRAWIAGVTISPKVWRWAPGVALILIAITWAVAGTPHIRFSAATHGNEPKYVRYGELWYQGVGFDTTALEPVADLPEDFRPRVWQNLTGMAAVLPGELRSLAADVRAFLADPTRRFNRARDLGGGGIAGKNGGVYQRHTPGLSLLMFPAYYLDRWFADVSSVPRDSRAQWPTRLPAVNTFFLALYAAWSVLIYRLLVRVISSKPIAWVSALTVTLTMPLATFPFQFYPELAAGVLLFAVVTYLLFPRRGLLASFFYGLLAGYLPWLHVRFSAVWIAWARSRLHSTPVHLLPASGKTRGSAYGSTRRSYPSMTFVRASAGIAGRSRLKPGNAA